MIRAQATDIVARADVPVTLTPRPHVVLPELSSALRDVRVCQLVFEYSRYNRDPWLVESIEIIGTHLFEQDGAWVDSELSARLSYTRREDGGRPELYTDQLPAWMHELARTWLPAATVVPLSHDAEEDA